MKGLLLADSRCRVTFKYENFKSSLGRLRQNIAPKSVPHVRHEYFPRSTNQIIDLWRCRCRCRRRFLVMTVTTRTIKVTTTTKIKASMAMMLKTVTRAHRCHLSHCFFHIFRSALELFITKLKMTFTTIAIVTTTLPLWCHFLKCLNRKNLT